MSDIVKDLREEIELLSWSELENPMLKKAADEIERLRDKVCVITKQAATYSAENERLRKELRDCNNWIRSELGLEEAEEIAERLG